MSVHKKHTNYNSIVGYQEVAMLPSDLIKQLNPERPVQMEELVLNLSVSERTIRNWIKDYNTTSQQNGFTIVNIHSKGYVLDIHDSERYHRLIENAQSINDIGNRQQRLSFLLYYLLQQTDFVSLQKLADAIQVSRNTLVNDLDEFEEMANKLEISVERKSHYGIRLVGNETILRKAFTRFVVGSNNYTSMIRIYFDFIEKLDDSKLVSTLDEFLNNRDIEVTKVSFDSIIEHIKVLLYRVSMKNYILDYQAKPVDQRFNDLALDLVQWLSQTYEIYIPVQEVEYLASQLAGKTSLEYIPIQEKERLQVLIQTILRSIDEEFITNFSLDIELQEALLLHMVPLTTRLTNRLNLDNPLIDEVSSRYANVFLIALRFTELWQEALHLDQHLTRDEIGYLALHFAGNIERAKQDALNRIKRVLIISDMGRSNVRLLKEKIQDLLPRSIVDSENERDSEWINQQDSHLIISTVTLDDKAIYAPVIYIKDMIHEDDLYRIKDLIILKSYISRDIHRNKVVPDLFSKRFFMISEEKDYLKNIEVMAHKMMNEKVAQEDFLSLVLERELKFTTIYQNGIAGPHGMVLNANVDCIGVTLLKQACIYEGKKVSIIFLINIRKGNLFLYREISRYLAKLMDDPKHLQNCLKAQDFEEFYRQSLLIEV